jgi:hypothetical protein
MDGITRSRETSLGRASGELFAQLPSSLAHSSRTILGVYAHHEAVSAHAIPSTLPHPELPPAMVVRCWFYQCLQCDVHLRVTILLLANLSSVVRSYIRPHHCFDSQQLGISLYRSTSVSTDQHYTSPTLS